MNENVDKQFFERWQRMLRLTIFAAQAGALTLH
jgi:hypothetical protein